MSENEKVDKVKKDDKKASPAQSRGIGRWFREMRSELKKVVWPTGKQTMKHTVTVIGCVIVVGAFIWAFDALATLVISALLDLTSGV